MARKTSKVSSPTKSLPRSKSVTIKKAINGVVVSSWDDSGDGGEKVYIAKNKKEADKYVSKLLK